MPDEALYAKATEIVWKYPDMFKAITEWERFTQSVRCYLFLESAFKMLAEGTSVSSPE